MRWTLLLAVLLAQGTASPLGAQTFTNPLISTPAADPWVIRHDGWYYFTSTGGDEISIRRSRTLTGLDDAEPVQVWRAPASGPQSKQVWAPELHYLQGKWYLYYTASDGEDRNHRHYVLEAVTDDPLGKYVDRGRVDPELDSYAIDGSVLQMPDGSLYWVYTTGHLEIAPMTSPTRVDGSRRARIASPTLPWERGWIEAPQALVREGRVFLVYSAGHSATPHYVLGLLTLTGSDPLDPGAWRKHDSPVFQPYIGPEGAVYTTGHCSFTTSPDGKEDWIVYHGKDWRDAALQGFAGRMTRAQRFGWHADGTPDFGHPIPSGVEIAVPSGEGAP
ncbi:MAG TPA: glycoside hydrolase family 43 protein [Longimicrobiaceae bacterium]